MPNHKSLFRLLSLILLAGVLQFAVPMKVKAFEPEFYASNSVLSSGNWAKIEVSESGMHFLSDNVIRSLGFSDPTKVNVFGYGGVVIPENLDSPDDLPLVPSQRVSGGLVFFGRGTVGWKTTTSGKAVYSHLSHPYSDKAYYFISDCLGQHKSPEMTESLTSGGETITDFTERLVHEQDLSMAMESGRLMLGEDFKTTTSRSFNFPLPGNLGDAVVTTAFACKSSANASLVFTANGKQLEASTSDQMSFSSTKLIVSTSTVKEVKDPGTTLNLNIKFNGGGVVTKAGLDYIEVEYPRALALSGNELYFYISPDAASDVEITGAGANTKVLDVTDPTRIVEIPATLSGATLKFVSAAGYHEYVAYNPSSTVRGATAVERVPNQDIHSMVSPGMLVISPAEYVPAAQRLAQFHADTDGLAVTVLTPEEIYNEFSCGKPDVSAFRKLLKMWYDRAAGEKGSYAEYCLIMSRPTYDNKKLTAVVKNAGYPRVPIWQSPTGETGTTSYSTDDYIGMLADVKGNFNIGTAVIHTAVGRMPVKSLKEANTVLDKLEEYILKPELGGWRNRVMVIADDQDGGVHLEQAESVVNAMQTNGYGNDFLYEKLYLDAYPLEYTGVGATYVIPRERLLNMWNKEGLAYINYIGHANEKNWGHENLYTWTDINSMSNSRLPFMYAATCEFMRWDEDEVSGAEVLWLTPNAGVIGMICPSREVLISANGVLNKSTSKFTFQTDDEGRPLSVGEIMRRGKNDSNTGTNKLRYGLIGDPSMRMPWPSLKARVDKINGIELAEAEDLPVLQARSSVTVSGHVEDSDGTLLSDFNGIMELVLYDAEKVVTTLGNGGGEKMNYNDRKTRLYIGKTKVKDGKWEINFTMPSEIENNYAPALISMYAHDEKAREANGSCEQLYVYGFDENAPDDFEGPKILEFYLDSPSFVNGSYVSPNPMLYIKVQDDSGISVSDAGIGHNITLSLDSKKHYDDIAQYYEPDENDGRTGTIAYSLGEISQGEHTLNFKVWDNANNSTDASLTFKISALWKPTIEVLTTDYSPDNSSVKFIIGTDGTSATMECLIEVFDLWGKKVWSANAPSLSGNTTLTTLSWNLNDFGGRRVDGGVYLYRATIKMANGASVSKTKKLMVR